MIWVIAAAPLWVTGFACFAAAIRGFARSGKWDHLAFWIAITLFVLYLAARMST